MRRRLTDEEREIRSGRGIPLGRFWAFPVMGLMVMLVSFDTALFERCLGNPLDMGGKGGAAVRMAAAVPCSVFLLGGSAWEWLLFVGLWAPLPFALLNRGWAKRHKAYWDGVRHREAERRAEKRAARERDRS